MKVVRFYDKGDIRIKDIPGPTAVPNTIGVSVTWCGICGTDLHEFMENPIFILPCGHPHPISGGSAPITMGHEFSGVAYAIDEDVDDIKVGQHVIVEPYIIHGDVPTSKGSNYHLSKDMNFIGSGSCDGGLSGKIAVRHRWAHSVSDKTPLGQAVLIEPLSVGHHTYIRSGAKEGDVALVGGTGPIGLLLTVVLRAKDTKVIITELSKAHKDKVREAGVTDYVLGPSEVDVVEEVKKLTNDESVDVAFECTNVNKVLDTMVEACCPTVEVVIVSIWSHPATVDIHSVTMKELDVCGTIAYCNDHAEVIKLVEEGKINLKPFITRHIKLDELISEDFECLIRSNESVVKIIVNPSLQS